MRKLRFVFDFIGATATLVVSLFVAAALAQPTTTRPNLGFLSTTSCLVTQFVLGGGSDLVPVCSDAMTSGQIMVGQSGTKPLPATLTGDVTIDNAGVTTVGTNKITNAKAAQMAANTVKGNFTGSTANASDITMTACANDGAHALTYVNGTGLQCASITGATATAPTSQSFTTGSGTYTTPVGVKWIEIYLVGGGGGSTGSGASPGSPTGGGNTCWNTTGAACTTPVYQAGGGGAAATNTANPSTGGVGGTIAGSGTCLISAVGNPGVSGQNSPNTSGGSGGGTIFGGGGGAGALATGGAPAANSGGGGGGSGSNNTAIISGAGGGGGGSCYVIIGTPAATYTYAVGAAGTGGTLGTSGLAGTNGAAGIIKVIEHYNY